MVCALPFRVFSITYSLSIFGSYWPFFPDEAYMVACHRESARAAAAAQVPELRSGCQGPP